MSVAASGGIGKGGAAFFSSLCMSTFGLGCWQSVRYFEKIEQMEQREKELAMEPQALENNAKCSLEEIQPSDQQSVLDKSEKDGIKGAYGNRGHRPLVVSGKFRYEDELLLGPRGPPLGALSATGPNSGRSGGGMASSPQGYYLITPLVRNNNSGTVLVNRGWVPRSYIQGKHPWRRPSGNVSIVGVASKTEIPRFMSPPHSEKEPKQLLWMDRVAIESKTKTNGQSPLIMTETVGDDQKMEDMAPFKPSLSSVGEFKVTTTTHAGYAATWFGLSGAGIIMTRKLITRGR